MPESGNRAVTIVPPQPRGSKVISARLHVAASDVDSLTPADARSLARALLAAAKDAEELDADALPHFDAALAAIDRHLTPAALLGVDDEALGGA